MMPAAPAARVVHGRRALFPNFARPVYRDLAVLLSNEAAASAAWRWDIRIMPDRGDGEDERRN